MYSLRTCGNIVKRHLRPSCQYGWKSIRPQQTAAIVAKESFINGSSSNYVEEMYASWLENPNSVHKVRVIGGVIFECYIIKTSRSSYMFHMLAIHPSAGG